MDTCVAHGESEYFESLRGNTASRTIRQPIEPCRRSARIVRSVNSVHIRLLGCSMTRLLCLRLHARPSGATLDHRHMTRRVTPSGRLPRHWVKGAQAEVANTEQTGSKGSALGGPPAQPWPYFPSRVPGAERGHEVYRARHSHQPSRVVIRTRRPLDRRSRLQRRDDATSVLLGNPGRVCRLVGGVAGRPARHRHGGGA